MTQKTDWGDVLVTGIPTLDEQHRLIAGLLDQLADMGDIGADGEAASELLSALGQLLIKHFVSEEALLETSGMPASRVALHILSHQQLLEQYVDINMALTGSVNGAGMPGVQEIVGKIRDWIVAHMVEYDHEIKQFLPHAGATGLSHSPRL